MKIKTQFVVCIVVFSVIMIIIAASVATTAQQVAQLHAQEEIANDIERTASSLNSISMDYFLYQEDLQLSRWESSLSSLHNDLSNMRLNSPQQQMHANNIAYDLQRIDSLFYEVSSYLQNASRNVSVRIDPAFQIRWSSMTVQSLALAFDASQLSRSLDDQSHQASITSTILVVSLVSVFGVFLATIYLLVFRRTLRSVAELQNGINTIGSGNLEFVIETKKQDEIAELSHSFNHMAANLKKVTASKTELENEIAERKRLQKQLEESAVKLEEYASTMEQLAEERLKNLKNSERLAAIGATAGMVGHDIRNPLQSIIGDLYLAKSDLDSLPQSEEKSGINESLTAIENSVTYINKIVQDLQDFAKPLNPHLEETDLRLVMNDLLNKNSLPENVKVKVEISPEAQTVMADPDFMKRVLCNLISNACQAMPNGGSLTIATTKENGNTVVTVQDTGTGIPADVQGKLFTPLFTTKSKGQGFGLAVVKRLTEAQKGTVTFTSQADKGTKFTLTLPQKL